MRLKENIVIILLIVVSSLDVQGQTNERYHVFLKKEGGHEMARYDTLVSLDFLSEKGPEGILNMQHFAGFNYHNLKVTSGVTRAILLNDSIKIEISTMPFDSVRFKADYSSDSLLYYKSLYFAENLSDTFPPFFPKTEISEISVTVNNTKISLPENAYKGLYNPDLQCWDHGKITMCPIHAYVAKNNKILLTLQCGEGAGASYVIFVFDRIGNLERRIEEPVI